MRTTEDRDAHGEAAAADADAETDEEMTATQEEQNIFENLSDLEKSRIDKISLYLSTCLALTLILDTITRI
ncbi:hypothetical protein H5410_002929 [Solanum commersonii]|uniref:Uncharacterized protein n=1 Tax=Solanum commersonii TaxID=4109 RepID=A0A9J6B3J5_SOLCO|nr:hypothetical protein H5410_002929 [Solanum commersonii]